MILLNWQRRDTARKHWHFACIYTKSIAAQSHQQICDRKTSLIINALRAVLDGPYFVYKLRRERETSTFDPWLFGLFLSLLSMHLTNRFNPWMHRLCDINEFITAPEIQKQTERQREKVKIIIQRCRNLERKRARERKQRQHGPTGDHHIICPLFDHIEKPIWCDGCIKQSIHITYCQCYTYKLPFRRVVAT